jgi:hypothetical protein
MSRGYAKITGNGETDRHDLHMRRSFFTAYRMRSSGDDVVFSCTLHLYKQWQNFYEIFDNRRSPLGQLHSEYELPSSVSSIMLYGLTSKNISTFIRM